VRIKNYSVPVDPMEDAQLRLVDEMEMVRNHFNSLGRLYAGRKWPELAHALSELEHVTRSAGFVVNEILRPATKELR
jgi:hypothetical protein